MQDQLNDEKKNQKRVINGNFFEKAQMDKDFYDQNELEKKKKMERMNKMLESLEKRDGMNENDLLMNLGANGGKKEQNYASILGIEDNDEDDKIQNVQRITREVKKVVDKNNDKMNNAERFFNEDEFKNVMENIKIVKNSNNNPLQSNNPNKDLNSSLSSGMNLEKNLKW